MGTPARRLAVWAAIFACGVAGFLWWAHADRRGFAGSIVRWFQGEGTAMQGANDLAEDLRTLPEWTQLQPWAVSVIRRFHNGELLTNSPPRYNEIAGYHLAPSEIPEFIKKRWGGTNEWGEVRPEISVVPASNEASDAVVIQWYSYRVVVGASEFTLPSEKSALSAKSKPGVYVYACFR